MAFLVETRVFLNYLELWRIISWKYKKEWEKILLEYFKSLGEDTQKIKLMESFFPLDFHGKLYAERVSF